MIGNTFVFDGAYHLVDLTFSYLQEDAPERDPVTFEKMLDVANRITGGILDRTGLRVGEAPPTMRGDVEANYDALFVQGAADMALVGNLAFNLFESADDPTRFLKFSRDLVAAYPERCLFGGGVDPLPQGLNHALDLIDHHIRELGARSMKFYPFEWACDDEKIAYPMYEKCRSLGCKVLQFHLCLPAAPAHKVELQRPNFLQRPAVDFPDLTFVMHHVVPLYFEETLNIAARIPNIHLMLAPLLQQVLIKPRLVQKMLGNLLAQVGSDKLSWGSEGVLCGNSRAYIEAFTKLEIPEDLREGYGFPQITKEDREKILGLNLARMFNIDVGAKRAELRALPAGR